MCFCHHYSALTLFPLFFNLLPRYLESHVPVSQAYHLSDIFTDLLNFSALHLVIGGRLVYWLPVYKPEWVYKLTVCRTCSQSFFFRSLCFNLASESYIQAQLACWCLLLSLLTLYIWLIFFGFKTCLVAKRFMFTYILFIKQNKLL